MRFFSSFPSEESRMASSSIGGHETYQNTDDHPDTVTESTTRQRANWSVLTQKLHRENDDDDDDDDDDVLLNATLQWGRQSDGMERKAFNSDDQRLSALIKHSAARSTAATLKLGSKRGYAWDIGPRLNS